MDSEDNEIRQILSMSVFKIKLPDDEENENKTGWTFDKMMQIGGAGNALQDEMNMKRICRIAVRDDALQAEELYNNSSLPDIWKMIAINRAEYINAKQIDANRKDRN
jgi:predicted AAA+ superfamily ATPase